MHTWIIKLLEKKEVIIIKIIIVVIFRGRGNCVWETGKWKVANKFLFCVALVAHS